MRPMHTDPRALAAAVALVRRRALLDEEYEHAPAVEVSLDLVALRERYGRRP